jgi:hypothetical protein
MKRRGLKWINAALFGLAMTSFLACSDETEPSGKGDVEFEITDAPSDDANVKAVMVTVAEVRVNGQAIEGFTKQTIDLKAYQEGSTKLLGSAKMDAKTYNNITLVLDLNTDENGNEPGCYVLSQDNAKFKLKSSSTGKYDLNLNQSWDLKSDAKTKVVIDFDLRKSIRYSDDASIKYSFVSEDNLKAAVRVVVREKSGTIKGSFEDESSTDAEKIIVYAYKKGSFNASSETEAQGVDQVMFKNAIGSAEVKSSLTGKTYTLAFLPEGDYELHFVAYNKSTETGRFVYAARLQSETSVNGSIGNLIQVKAGASVNISSTVKGVI